MNLRIAKFNFFLFPLYLLLIPIAQSQTTNEKDIYILFDNIVGKENLNISNGPLHNNPFISVKNKHRYFVDKFMIGDISYEQQLYFDVNLKYDILEDQIVFKLNKQTDNLAINLIRDRVDFFFLGKKKFINLNTQSGSIPEVLNGFYEENFIGNSIHLYIKHKKFRKEIFYFDGFYSDYAEKNEYIIKHLDNYLVIDSENQLKQLFPEYKNAIRNFFNINREIEKSNKLQFMENLVRYIDGLSNKNNK